MSILKAMTLIIKKMFADLKIMCLNLTMSELKSNRTKLLYMVGWISYPMAHFDENSHC